MLSADTKCSSSLCDAQFIEHSPASAAPYCTQRSLAEQYGKRHGLNRECFHSLQFRWLVSRGAAALENYGTRK